MESQNVVEIFWNNGKTVPNTAAHVLGNLEKLNFFHLQTDRVPITEKFILP